MTTRTGLTLFLWLLALSLSFEPFCPLLRQHYAGKINNTSAHTFYFVSAAKTFCSIPTLHYTKWNTHIHRDHVHTAQIQITMAISHQRQDYSAFNVNRVNGTTFQQPTNQIHRNTQAIIKTNKGETKKTKMKMRKR